jgi:GAF domain-containing protein/biotin operon repressor
VSPAGTPRDIYDRTLAVFDRSSRPCEPLTTPEVADALNCARRTVYKRLDKLVDRGDLRTKKVSSSGRVWWRPSDGSSERAPTETVSERDELRERERALRRAYGVIADPDRSFRGKVDALLTVVRETIGMEYATLSHVRDDEYVFEWVDAPDDADLQAGDTVALSVTNCERAVATEQTLVLRDIDADAPELASRTGNAEWGISCYLGAPVFVDGDVYGTFCFYDMRPREEAFSDWEVTFVELLGNWASYELERQRYTDRLVALDELNGVVRRINDAVIEQSTREEIERVVVDAFADADSYEFAWIGDVRAASETVELRCEAGVEDSLDGVPISVDPDDPRTTGPVDRAIRTHEVQVVQDAHTEPWRERARKYGFRSSAAVPIVHGQVLYGVLDVYTARPGAFAAEEHEVIGQLGEVVGHAIAALQRKRALMSDELVELEFRIPDVFASLDLPHSVDGTVRFDRTVPTGNGSYLKYGTATGDTMDVVAALVEAESFSHWEWLNVLDDGLETRFEVGLTEPPVISMVAACGGYVHEATIDDGEYQLGIHLAPSTDVQHVVDTVTATYSGAEMMTRRQTTRSHRSTRRIEQTLSDRLTERQQAALEAGYFAGFFEWPRTSSGEDVASSLGVSPSTYHQHLRKAENKLLDILFAET